MTGQFRPEGISTSHLGRFNNATLSVRLESAQRTLALLEREYLLLARDGGRPDDWGAWADLSTALMAVRAAQGRDARNHPYLPRAIVDSEP